MQLRNGTNTISDARFETAQERLSTAHDADRWRAAEGRTEELPYQTAARHAREFSLLAQDRQNLSVQEWLKRYPDLPDIKQREGRYAEAASHPDETPRSNGSRVFGLEAWDEEDDKEDQFQQAISGPVTEIKNLSDDVLIDVWERRAHADPAIERAAAHELAQRFPGFHATPSLGNKLTTEKNYEAAASSFAASEHRHNAGRTSFWSSEISAGKALREQHQKRQEQTQKPRQQQM